MLASAICARDDAARQIEGVGGLRRWGMILSSAPRDPRGDDDWAWEPPRLRWHRLVHQMAVHSLLSILERPMMRKKQAALAALKLNVAMTLQ